MKAHRYRVIMYCVQEEIFIEARSFREAEDAAFKDQKFGTKYGDYRTAGKRPLVRAYRIEEPL